LPDWSAVHLELKKKHVTKQLLWEEYKGKSSPRPVLTKPSAREISSG
jgi:hypothetical protein